MKDRKIQKMVKRGEITHEEGKRMAAAKAAKFKHSREQTIGFCNSERYADPTAFHAMQNIVREQFNLCTRNARST